MNANFDTSSILNLLRLWDLSMIQQNNRFFFFEKSRNNLLTISVNYVQV